MLIRFERKGSAWKEGPLFEQPASCALCMKIKIQKILQSCSRVKLIATCTIDVEIREDLTLKASPSYVLRCFQLRGIPAAENQNTNTWNFIFLVCLPACQDFYSIAKAWSKALCMQPRGLLDPRSREGSGMRKSRPNIFHNSHLRRESERPAIPAFDECVRTCTMQYWLRSSGPWTAQLARLRLLRNQMHAHHETTFTCLDFCWPWNRM